MILPRSNLRAVVPLQRTAEPVVHADVEIGHDEDRRLQPVGEVERLRGHLEGFGRVLGEQQHVLGVAVRGVGAAQQVALLRARRHAGRGTGALHVDDHGRNLGEVGEAEELLHQRDAGAGGRREGARAVPARADHHADRGELVLGLDDGEAVLLVAVGAVARAMALERLGERGRRRDRIPGAHRRAAVDGAERRGAVALDEDAVADRVRLLQLERRSGMSRLIVRVVAAEMQRVHVRLDQRVLAAELLGDQLLDHADVHVEQRRRARRHR